MGCPDPELLDALRSGLADASTRDEIRSHLQVCPRCLAELGGRLDPTVDLPGAADRSGVRLTDATATPAPGSGDRAGDFVLGTLLGSGGAGSVYRARDLRGGPDVALKIIAGDRCDEPARRRFGREAAALGALGHPGIVRVFDSGTTEDGGVWLAMELLDGEDLLRCLRRRGPLAPSEVARIGLQAAEALGAAHEAGIIHRDIKPANLFLGGDDRVVLVDFGLALRVAGEGDTRMTSSGALLGTPAYMAIEQAVGQRDEDERTDVWGLGATLYHAAAGRTPFRAPSVTAELVRVVSDEPSPLPDGFPRWLAAIVLRCLDKDRSRRWPSMKDLAAALRAGLAKSARAATSDGEPSASCSRPPAALAPVALEDEVRVVALLLGTDVRDASAFVRAVKAEQGAAWPILGGCAIGVFGGEAWRGDESERAVRAGLAARRHGAARQLGVATGRAFRALAGALTGEVVASAEKVGAGEGVGVDVETERRVRGAFVIAGGVATAARPTRRVLEDAGAAGAGLPFVGRDRELADLVATFRQVIGETEARGVLVLGPPGIGKSRLTHELVARIEADAIVLEAVGEPNRTLQGWHPLAGAIRTLADVPEGTAAAVLRARLLALCPSRRAAEFLGELLGAGFPETPELIHARCAPGVMQDQIRRALGDLVEALATKTPVVLLVEDAHWADARTLEALAVLLRRLERLPVLVVATARTDADALPEELRRLPLEGVSRAAVRTIAGAVGGDGAQQNEALVDRAGGNPYFAQELARAQLLGQPELPASVGAAIQARLDVLGRSDRDLLRRAAVLGARFWTEALEALGSADAAALLPALRRRDLVVPEPRPRLAGMHEWRFRHALVQEVAYASLTEPQRAALHLQAAHWLEGRGDAPAIEVARHLDLGGAVAEAAPYFRRAAATAFREGDATAALEASERALPHTSDRAQILSLRRMRAETLFFLGRRPEHRVETDELQAIATTDEDRAVAQLNLVRALHFAGDWPRAVEVGQQALAHDPDDADIRAEVALVLAISGRLDEARAQAQITLAAAERKGDPRLLGRALRILSACCEARGDAGPAVPLLERALAAFQAAGNPRSAATVRGALACMSLALGRAAEAVPLLENARAESRAVGNLLAEAYGLDDLGLARARAGDVEGGLAAKDEALEFALELGEKRLEMAARTGRAAILVEAGRWAEALTELDDALAEPDDRQGSNAAALHTLRATALQAVGRTAESRPDAERALRLRDEAGGMERYEGYCYAAAAAAGVEGALERGLATLEARAARIADPAMRRDFLERVPDHALLVARARAAGLAVPS